MNVLYGISWTEHERGWGQRPDGISFHRSREDAVIYIENYWARMPKEVPDDYSSPSEPYLIEVSPWIYDHVQSSGDWWSAINNKATALTYIGDKLSNLTD